MRKTDCKDEAGLSLEDLFEVKRQEKPDPEYWEEFDHQFQQKMLGSMVDRSSLVTRLFKFVTHKLLPLAVAGGAMAAFVLSLTPLWNTGTDSSAGAGVSQVVAKTEPVRMLDFPEGSSAEPPVVEDVQKSLNFLITEVDLPSFIDREYATNPAVMFSGPLSGTDEHQF